jgi:hypothetical protein
MKRALLTVALIAVAFAVPSFAQDEAPGQQSLIVASVPTGGFNCGRAGYSEYCYGVPANVGGTFWLDCYYNGAPNGSSGLILFNNVADLGQATIDSAIVAKNSAGLVTKLDITLHGSTDDRHRGTYTGTGTFTFSYYYSPGGGGRGGASYRQLMQSGSLTSTYN